MNRTNWIQLERWYTGLHRIQQWLVKIGLVICVLCFILVVTHEPRERTRHANIILNCDHCGTDPERTISYNDYMNQKEQQQVWFKQERKRLRQEIWDERGRQRWCSTHLYDVNCKQ